MRVNVYSQELTSEVKPVSKESDGRQVTGLPCYPNGQPNGDPRACLPGYLVDIWRSEGCPNYVDATNPWREVREEPIVYHAAQLILHSTTMLHHFGGKDDDRSAVTFWLPKSQDRREAMAKAFEEIARIFRTAPAGGAD